MDKFTQLTAEQIVSVLKHKLKSFEEQGIKVDITETKFSDIYMEAKVVFNLVNRSADAEEERHKYFDEMCETVGLKKEHYGMTFKVPNSAHTYTIAGLDFHDEEPILVKINDGEEYYRMSVNDVKRFI